MIVKPHPRTENVFVRAGKPLVAKAPHNLGDYLQSSITTVVDLLGGLKKIIRPGDKVMLKPNFNCPYATPLSTELGYLAAAIEVLQDAGAMVTVGEMSGRIDWPTEGVIAKLGVLPVLHRYGVPFVNFQYDEWLPMQVDGKAWKTYRVPRSMYEADKRIYLPNMRPHVSGGFTGALKLGVGWLDLEARDYLHGEEQKAGIKYPEVNLGWQPDLILMDMRRTTTEWHGRGKYVFPGLIMASGDLVAIDAEGVKVLKGYEGDNRLGGPIEEMEVFARAVELGLGSLDYEVIEAPANTETEQKQKDNPVIRKLAAADEK